MSTAHHPQTDGATERVNQEIEAYLAIFCANNPDKWAKLIPTLEFSYNKKPHASRNQSPFYLQLGADPKAIPTIHSKTNMPGIDEWLKELQQARDEALAMHKLAQQTMLERTTRGFKPFKKNDRVWLESKHLKLCYESKKIAPKREGPFTISEVLGPLTYCLDLPRQWKIHPVFHASLLTPYKENDTHRTNYENPPPDLIEGQPEYEVETIISYRRQGRGYAYLVK